MNPNALLGFQRTTVACFLMLIGGDWFAVLRGIMLALLKARWVGVARVF